MKKITFFIFTFLLCGLSAAVAQHSFAAQGPETVASGTPVTLSINDVANAAGVPAGLYDSFSVSADWSEIAGGPYSSEADLTLTTTAGPVIIDPATSGSALDALPTTLIFAGDIAGVYDPSTDGFLEIVLNQSWSGSSAEWTNIVVTLFEVPTCQMPTDGSVNDVTDTAGGFTWVDEPNGSLGYEVELGAAGFAPGTGALILGGSANPGDQGVGFSGLTPSTAYDIYIRTNCDTDGFSLWAGPFSFTTLGGPGEGCILPLAATVETDCSTATPITIDFATAPNIGGTGTCDATGDNRGFWYEFTAPASGTINISNSGANNEYVILDACGGTELLCGAMAASNEISGLTPSAVYKMAIWKDSFQTLTMDDFCIEEVSCGSPSALMASNITTASAELAWTAGGAEILWDIELVDITAAGAATGTPTSMGVTNPYTQMSLVENNEYEFYVRADCGGSTSDWAGPFAFTTPCSPLTPDYTADMSVNVPDSCWNEAGSGDPTTGPMSLGASDWRQGTSYALGASNAINLFSNTDSEWLLSPTFDLSTGGPYQLEVNVAVTNWNAGTVDDTMGSDDEAQLLMSTDDGATWTNITTWNVANEPPVGGVEYVEDLTALTGNVMFAVWATDGTINDAEDYDFHVGKFRVREIPSCADPSALMVGNISDASADFSWMENGTATTWDVEIVDITAGGTVTGTPTIAATANNPLSLTGLVEQNDYEVYVRAICGGSTSAWIGPMSFTTPCSALTPDYTADMSVNVPDSCWNEAGSGDPSTGPMGLGASDWRQGTSYALGSSNALNLYFNNDSEWLLSPTFDLSTGGPYQLEVNVAVTNWNGGTVDDTMGSDDEVQLLMSTDGGATWTNITTWNAANEPPVGGVEYVEDLTALTGNVMFAIWGTDGTVDDAEDYDFHVGKFRVREIPSCLEPATVMNSVLTDMTSDFTWLAGGTETTWEYANLPSPSTEPASGTSTMTATASFTGLTPLTDYDFYVRSDCGGVYSSWVQISYTTPATPPMNDDCLNATALTPGAVYTDNPVDGTVAGATDDLELASCGLDGAGVWYSIVVPASGDITIEVSDDSLGGTGFDSVIEAFTGTCGALTSIGCDDDGAAGFDGYSLLNLTGLTGGETIYVRVWEYGGNDEEPFSISAFSASLGIDDVNNEAAFTFYPNPVKNTLTLNAQKTIEQVAMYNMLGQEVLRATPNAVDSDLDMSNLQTGTYFVKVTIANVTQTIRVIKQ